MKPRRWFHAACLTITLVVPAAAETIYSNLQDTPIPLDFTGGTFTFAGGGSINPFFGGVGVANNDLLQPVRTGTTNLSSLANLVVGSTIDFDSIFSTENGGAGYGGSQTHLGTTFTDGQEGYVGFKLNDTNFGWMRVVFTANTTGAVVRDWAYDDSGASMVVGRVQQSAVSAGTQTVTLSPGTGESFSLGSVIADSGGNINSVLKTGAGTTTLSGVNTYTGATIIGDGTLALDASGSIDNTDSVSLGTGGTFDVSAKSGGYTVDVLTGSGMVIGALTVADRLAIGDSTGTITFEDSLTLDAASSYVYEMSGGEPPDAGFGDLGIVEGDLTLNVGTILDLVQLGAYTAGDKFTLFDYKGTLTGTFRDVNSNNLADGATFVDGGGIWMIDYDDTLAGANGGSGFKFVTITAIPEPGVSAFIGAFGLIGLLRRRR
ncbi:MAG: autotransporter-associated beta strand repeat-containing protein [Akkermansiaceae bacterium]|nr:autotransporter-associated beta strand repeat-containing protein [Akkermansiaceae bacterium]MCP5547385.1 autotransporter-associated beta strand repeat-containing protein [Akkermansiaceae bacterium]